MTQSGQKGFEGWYFKHQRREEMVAFIPGRAESGPFLQMISPQGARQFAVSRLTAGGGMVRADRCWFSTRGCHIELPGVRGNDFQLCTGMPALRASAAGLCTVPEVRKHERRGQERRGKDIVVL